MVMIIDERTVITGNAYSFTSAAERDNDGDYGGQAWRGPTSTSSRGCMRRPGASTLLVKRFTIPLKAMQNGV
ncbi:MAG: hypothetical protein U0Z44_11190 [Kouleothrix sp.]